MPRFKANLTLFVALSLGAFSTLNADVVFNFSPATDGTADLEIVGTGQVVVGSVGFFAQSNSAFLPPGISVGTSSFSPAITLDGFSALFLNFDEDVLSFAVGEDFSNFPAAGAELSELTGTYSTALTFADLPPGQFQFFTLTSGDFAFGGDLGPITVNIAAAVPEPSSGSILLLGSTLLALARRKR